LGLGLGLARFPAFGGAAINCIALHGCNFWGPMFLWSRAGAFSLLVAEP